MIKFICICSPAVLTSTPRPSIGCASVATSSSQYCTADEGTIGGGDRTMTARGLVFIQFQVKRMSVVGVERSRQIDEFVLP